LDVQSWVGIGSIFTFRFPTNRPEKKVRQNPKKKKSKRNSTKKELNGFIKQADRLEKDNSLDDLLKMEFERVVSRGKDGNLDF
jgi:hypothetical protein